MKSLIGNQRILRVTLMVALTVVSSVEAEPPNSSAFAGRSVVPHSKDNVGVQVAHSNGVDQVAIDTDSEHPVFQVKRLENPSRLIIDLTSQRISSSKSLAIADLDRVSSIRIGAQPTSGRIVMDLAEGQNITHNVRSEGGKIVVTLSSGGTNFVQEVTQALDSRKAEKPSVLPIKSEPRLPDVEEHDDANT